MSAEQRRARTTRGKQYPAPEHGGVCVTWLSMFECSKYIFSAWLICRAQERGSILDATGWSPEVSADAAITKSNHDACLTTLT